MKTDYEKCIGFCEAEIESPQSEMFTVIDRGTHYAISLPLPESVITIYKPSRASIFDKNRVSFGEGYQTPYSDLPIWSHVAHMLGLEPVWIACSDRLPESDDDYLVLLENGSAVVAEFLGLAPCSVFGAFKRNWWRKDGEEVCPTHWQPMPAKP